MAAIPIIVYATDLNGAPASGAKLFSYAEGTTTPRGLFTDAGLTTAATNPVICNSRGVSVVWADDTLGNYKLVVKNSAESETYYEQDGLDLSAVTPYLLVYPSTSSAPSFASLLLTGALTAAGATISGTMNLESVTVSPSGATVGQALGFPNAATTLEPYTPAGAGDTLKAANETISGNWAFSGAPDFSGVSNAQAIRQALSVDHVVSNLAALRAATKANLPDAVFVQGGATEGDGGDGVFVWDSDSTASDDDGHVIAPAAGGSGRWVRAGLSNVAKLESYGLDASGVENATDGAASYIDMAGATVTTTRNVSAMTTPYFNGTLIAQNGSGNASIVKPQAPLLDHAIERPRTKCPVLDWDNKKILWLGTSIPAQGNGLDSYPELFAQALGASVVNNAWAGSHAGFDASISSPSINDVKALSMTAADQAVLAAAYPATFWNDTDPVTKASEMTADHRIKTPFASTPFDVVVLDHNHNDRLSDPGTLGGVESTAISAATLGASTVFTVASAGTLAIGDGVAVTVSGVSRLNHAAGRVTAVSGTDITVAIDSSTYTGTVTSGTLTKYDRNTFYGSFEFLLHFILWSAADQGLSAPTIILAGAPSEFTNNAADAGIYSSARYIKNIADAWSYPFFDIGHIYDVKLQDHLYYFPDNVHPSTAATRQALTNQWVAWASGGQIKRISDSDYLPRGGSESFSHQRSAYYSRFKSGFADLDWIVGNETSIVSEDWSGGLTGWGTSGATAPTVVAAPWNASEFALKPNVATGGFAFKTGLSGGTDGFNLEFDLWMDAVSGLTTESTARIVTIARIFSGAGLQYTVDLLVSAARTKLRLGVWDPSVPAYFADTNAAIQAGTQHTVRVEAVRATSGQWDGAVLMTLDGEEYVYAAPTTDTMHTTTNRIDLGATYSNLTGGADVYIGNIDLNAVTVHDFRNRFTGTWTNAAAQTVTVVNGIITDVS